MQGGLREARCWTALDVYVMEKVVPIAPYTLETVIDVVPSRVVNYAFDQSSNEIAGPARSPPLSPHRLFRAQTKKQVLLPMRSR